MPVEIVHCFADVMKLNLGRNSEARFGQDFEVEVQARFEAGALPVFLLVFCRGY